MATQTETQTAIDAISRSSAMDQIVHVRGRGAQGVAEELRSRASDYCENQKNITSGGDVEYVSDYWGEDSDGDWRVITHTWSEV